MRDAPTLVLVTGLPGTGKSTVAAVAANFLSTVVAHDWAMSGLRPFPDVQAALDRIDWGHRHVGWSILVALARAQLVEARSVVLDGVARAPQVEQCRGVAHDVGARFVLVATECSDPAIHRSRIEERQRFIPGWYELRWDAVERSVSSWEPVTGDLHLDAAAPRADNESMLRQFLAAL